MNLNSYILAVVLVIPGALNNVLSVEVTQGGDEVAARRFDEIDLTQFYYGDMKARLDGFIADALTKEPDSRAYLILYRARGARQRFRPRQLRDYMVNVRGLPAVRVKAVYGGYREAPALELWVVPEGAADPKATPTVTGKRRRKR